MAPAPPAGAASGPPDAVRIVKGSLVVTPPAPGAAGRGARRPLLVTAEPGGLDEMLRLCVLAGVEPEVAVDTASARTSWARAALVVVGIDLLAELAAARLPRRDRVVVLAQDPTDVSGYAHAVQLGADRVVFLPDEQQWLVGELARPPETGQRALTVGVAGGRGGAGATTLAVALAVTATRTGTTALLVDGDPLGGGVDLAVGAEDVPGARWPDLAASTPIDALTLLEALPTVDSGGSSRLPLLSWDRGSPLPPDPDVTAAVLQAAVTAADLVVLDLPRRLDDSSGALLDRADVVLMVVPAEIRACAAAGRLAEQLGSRAREVRLVVRGPAPGGLDADGVCRAVGLPLAGELRPEPGLAAALERGEPPGSRTRGPLARFCRALLADLVVTSASA